MERLSRKICSSFLYSFFLPPDIWTGGAACNWKQGLDVSARAPILTRNYGRNVVLCKQPPFWYSTMGTNNFGGFSIAQKERIGACALPCRIRLLRFDLNRVDFNDIWIQIAPCDTESHQMLGRWHLLVSIHILTPIQKIEKSAWPLKFYPIISLEPSIAWISRNLHTHKIHLPVDKHTAIYSITRLIHNDGTAILRTKTASAGTFPI